MPQKAILITGGAGYIGSHVLLQLQARGERVVALDNLHTGFRQAVRAAPLIVGDVGDRELVARVLREHEIDTVMHFAANTIVPESVREPLKYYGNNTCATRNLLAAACAQGVRQMVFSSTAAVYGIPPGGIADEGMPLAPVNPYGTSKLMSEWMLRDLAAVSDFRYVSLRYFNVAGSDPQGRIGQSTRAATLLIKVACEAMRRQAAARVDLRHRLRHARRHRRARLHPRRGCGTRPRRCARLSAAWRRRGGVQLRLQSRLQRARGTRRACSVSPVRPLTIREEPRRAGDPPVLIARAERIRSQLGWNPQLDDLDAIVASALRWERILQREPW